MGRTGWESNTAVGVWGKADVLGPAGPGRAGRGGR